MSKRIRSIPLDPKIEQDSEVCQCQKDRVIYLEAELSDARKRINEIALEKVKLENDTKRLWKENAVLQQEYLAKSDEVQIAETKAKKYESMYNEISMMFNKTVADCKKFDDSTQNLKREVYNLRKQIEEYHENMEKYTLIQGDLTDTIQSLHEDLSSKDKLLNELRDSIAKWKEEESQYHHKMDDRFSELSGRIHTLESNSNEQTARIRGIEAELNRLRELLPVVVSVYYFDFFI